MVLHHPRRCFPVLVSLLASHPITSTCTLSCPFCQLLPSLFCHLYWHLSGRKSLNSLCRIFLTKVSTDQFSCICQYQLMKESGKKMVLRAHLFYFSVAYERPTILITLPLLTVPSSPELPIPLTASSFSTLQTTFIPKFRQWRENTGIWLLPLIHCHVPCHVQVGPQITH